MDEGKQISPELPESHDGTPPPVDATEWGSDNIFVSGAELRRRLNEMFTSVDLRVPVVFWLVVGLLVLLFPAWAAGEARVVDRGLGAGGQGVSVVFSVVIAMLDPLVLLVAALAISVYSGVVNLGIWGFAALSAVLMGLLVPCLGPVVSLVLMLAMAIIAGLVLRMLACRGSLTAMVAALLMGLVGNLLCLTLGGNTAPVSSGMASSALAVSVFSAFGLVLVIYLAGLRRPGPTADTETAEVTGRAKNLHLLVVSMIAAVLAGCVSALSGSGLGSGGLVLGDMRVAVAAVICLVTFRRGRSGAILSCILAPIGLLVANMWLQCVGFAWAGVAGSQELLALAVMVAGIRLIVMGRGYRVLRRFSASLAAVGVLSMAASCYWPVGREGTEYLYIGLLVWVAGFLLGASRIGMLLKQ